MIFSQLKFLHIYQTALLTTHFLSTFHYIHDDSNNHEKSSACSQQFENASISGSVDLVVLFVEPRL